MSEGDGEQGNESKVVEPSHTLFDYRTIERMLDGKVSPDKVKQLLEAAARYDQTRSESIKRQVEARTAAFLDIRKHEGEMEDRRETRRFKSLLVVVVLTVLVTAGAVALLSMNLLIPGSVMVAFAGVGLGGCLVLAPGSPMEPKDVQKLAETMAKVFSTVSEPGLKSLPPPPDKKSLPPPSPGG